MSETNSQRVAKNTGFLFIRSVVILLVTLYTSRVVLKVLGFEDFGLYNVVGSVVVFFSFIQGTLSGVTSRHITYELGSGTEDSIKKMYSMAINAHILLAIILFFIMEVGGVWFLNTKLNIAPSRLYAANWTYQISLITFCLKMIQTPLESNIIAHERMNFYAYVSIGEVVLKLLMLYLLVISPFDKLISYSFLWSFITFVTFIVKIFYCRKVFPDCTYIRYWDKSILLRFIKYAGWSSLVTPIDVATQQCRSIFFNLFFGVVANAALGVANQVTGQVTNLVNTFTQAFNPQIIKSYAAGQYDYFKKLLFTTSKMSYFLMLFICIPVIANADFVLGIWLGDYPTDAPSFIVSILCFALIDSCQAPFWSAVHATGKLKVHQIAMGSIKAMAIPGMYISLKLGASALFAMYVIVICNFICAVTRTIHVSHLVGFSLKKYISQVIFKIIIITALTMPLPLYIVHVFGQNILGFLVSCTVSVISVSLLVFFVGLNSDERRLLLSLPVISKVVNLFKKSK